MQYHIKYFIKLDGPRWPRDGPEMAPRRPKEGPKMAPRWPQKSCGRKGETMLGKQPLGIFDEGYGNRMDRGMDARTKISQARFPSCSHGHRSPLSYSIHAHGAF